MFNGNQHNIERGNRHCDEPPINAVLIEQPYSEVCMHMHVAGKVMFVAPHGPHMAQLYTLSGHPFSFPITNGEAGLR